MSLAVEKLNKKVSTLQEELSILRSFMIGMIEEKDKEGEYRPEFIIKTLKAASEKTSFPFLGRKAFLRKLQN